MVDFIHPEDAYREKLTEAEERVLEARKKLEGAEKRYARAKVVVPGSISLICSYVAFEVYSIIANADLKNLPENFDLPYLTKVAMVFTALGALSGTQALCNLYNLLTPRRLEERV